MLRTQRGLWGAGPAESCHAKNSCTIMPTPPTHPATHPPTHPQDFSPAPHSPGVVTRKKAAPSCQHLPSTHPPTHPQDEVPCTTQPRRLRSAGPHHPQNPTLELYFDRGPSMLRPSQAQKHPSPPFRQTGRGQPSPTTPHTHPPAVTSVLPSCPNAAARALPFIFRLPTLVLLTRLTRPMCPLSPRKATKGVSATGLTTKLSQLFMPTPPLLPGPRPPLVALPPRCCLLPPPLLLRADAGCVAMDGLLLGAPVGARLMQGGVTTRSSWPAASKTGKKVPTEHSSVS